MPQPRILTRHTWQVLAPRVADNFLLGLAWLSPCAKENGILRVETWFLFLISWPLRVWNMRRELTGVPAISDISLVAGYEAVPIFPS